jgi:hypothetical protein
MPGHALAASYDTTSPGIENRRKFYFPGLDF